MKKSRFSEEQVIGILREQEADHKTADICRRHGISEATFCAWKSKYGGLDMFEAKKGSHRSQSDSRRIVQGPAPKRCHRFSLRRGSGPARPAHATFRS